MTPSPTIHATAVLVGAKAALIRGPAGSGKSRLALRLLQTLPFACLVGDDRIHVDVHHGRLVARPAAELAGLIEVRGLGIIGMPFESEAVVGLIIDLAGGPERLPKAAALKVTLFGVTLSRLELPAESDPLPAVLAALPGIHGHEFPVGKK